MVVIAVEHLNIYAGFAHAASKLAELAGFILIKTLYHDVANGNHAYACGLQCTACRFPVVDKKVRNASIGYDPCAAPFNADPSTSERFAHFAQRARTIFQFNRKIFQSYLRATVE